MIFLFLEIIFRDGDQTFLLLGVVRFSQNPHYQSIMSDIDICVFILECGRSFKVSKESFARQTDDEVDHVKHTKKHPWTDVAKCCVANFVIF